MSRNWGLKSAEISVRRCGLARMVIGIIAAFAIVIFLIDLITHAAWGRDNGTNTVGLTDDQKAWFEHLASGKGLCCSSSDGKTVSDVDWDSKDGHYRVRLNGEWIDVPDSAVVKEPNLYGLSVVWPFLDIDGNVQIRCFLAGAGT